MGEYKDEAAIVALAAIAIMAFVLLVIVSAPEYNPSRREQGICPHGVANVSYHDQSNRIKHIVCLEGSDD